MVQAVLDKRLGMWEKYCLLHCFAVPEGFSLPKAVSFSYQLLEWEISFFYFHNFFTHSLHVTPKLSFSWKVTLKDQYLCGCVSIYHKRKKKERRSMHLSEILKPLHIDVISKCIDFSFSIVLHLEFWIHLFSCRNRLVTVYCFRMCCLMQSLMLN